MDIVPPRIYLMPLFPGAAEGIEARWWAAVEGGNVMEAHAVYEESSVLQHPSSSSSLVRARRSSSRLTTMTSRAAACDAITPLLLAADRGHAAMVGYLLQLGANPTEASRLSMPEPSECVADDADRGSWLVPLTPLDRAVERGHVAVIEELLVWAWTVHRLERRSGGGGGGGGGGSGVRR
jgi:hypothetical protein